MVIGIRIVHQREIRGVWVDLKHVVVWDWMRLATTIPILLSRSMSAKKKENEATQEEQAY